MSLIIELESVYTCNGQIQNKIQCLCKIIFRNSTKNISLYENGSSLGTKLLKSDEFYEEDEVISFLSQTSSRIKFGLGTKIKLDDVLRIECYKPGKFQKKPFGVYTMLLESLTVTEKSIEIDDFLSDPKKNILIQEKIRFLLKYREPVEKKIDGLHIRVIELDEEKNSNLNNMLDVESDLLDLEELDFMNMNSDLNISNQDNSLKYKNQGMNTSLCLKNAIGKATLSLAQVAYNPNFILNDEMIKDEEFINEMLKNLSDSKGLRMDKYVTQLICKRHSNRLTSWQVRVNLIEIRHLLGTNKEVYCIINIGNQVFKSNTKPIDKLKYLEIFTARFDNIRSSKLFSQLISILVYFKQFLKSDLLIGKFEIDLGTIYSQQNHEYYHKWGCILPDDNTISVGSSGGNYSSVSSPKAFIKCDLLVLAKGDKAISHPKDDTEIDDEINNNMILPHGLERPREMIELNVVIHSAHILMKYRVNKFNKIKNQIINLKKNLTWSNEDEDVFIPNTQKEKYTLIQMENDANKIDFENLNLFIRITFCGITRRTSSIKSNAKPIWNESFKFVYLFPSLIRLFQIELCCEESFGEKVLAIEYLNIEEISDYSTKGFLPTFGPSNIDMYSEPGNQRIRSNTLNCSSSDLSTVEEALCTNTSRDFNSVNKSYIPINGSFPGGGDYVARLLLKIESNSLSNLKYQTKSKNNLQDIQESVLMNQKKFTLFAMISDLNMIDSRYQSDLSFQLCLGPFGYEGSYRMDLSKRNSSTNMTKNYKSLRLGPKMPIYLPFDKVKPCMTLNFCIEDLRHIMFLKNFLLKKIKILLSNAYNLFNYYQNLENFKKYRSEILRIIKYIQQVFLKNEFTTELDEKKAKRLVSNLDDTIRLIKSLPTDKKSDSSFRKFDFNRIIESIARVNKYLNEPLSLFPDVNLWLLSNNEPIGICTIKPSDIIWSEKSIERGVICNQMTYTDIKSLSDFQKPLSENLARIRFYLWLGLENEIDNIFTNMPRGYGLNEKFFNQLNLPTQIFFNKKLCFEMKANIYQGRDLLGLDSTGLSDPYVKITIGNQTVFSKTIIQTNNPKWNVSLSISEIYSYLEYEAVVENPPEIILELYDQDLIGENEFMGKTIIKPIVLQNFLTPPRLKWHKIQLGNELAGDVLASFELILLTEENKSQRELRTEKIPWEIVPMMSTYSLEIIFWGLRNVKLNNSVLFNHERIKICVQIGDQTFESNKIENFFANDNFLNIYQKHIIELPIQDEYKPHLNIKCLCENSIGKEKLIGSFTVKTINNFFKNLTELREKYRSYVQKENGRNLVRMNSSYYTNIENDTVTSISKKVNIVKEKIIKPDPEFDCEYLDWWSKYYASTKIEDSDLTSNEFTLNNSDITETQVDDKKQRRLSLSSLKNFTSKAKKLKLAKEEDMDKNLHQSDNIDTITVESSPKMEKIEILDCELEKDERFSERFDMLRTFPLYIGKNQQHNSDAIHCHFKGNFLIYKEDSSLHNLFENSILTRYGGFLGLTPPNTPVPVKVRVYIVNAVLNPPTDNRLFDPYISIQVGDRSFDYSETTIYSTLEPTFGCMYEYDIKLPYESQMTISIKDWSLIGNKSLIGKTIIDLEDRFYSSCYAMCGLPKKYEISGYNAWRDKLFPSQILTLMCRKWRLKLPDYGSDYLIVYTLEEKSKEYKFEINEEKSIVNKNDQFVTSIKTPAVDYRIVREELALSALNDWHNITGTYLVPEHLENRYLYNPDQPEFEQGKIRMWIDLFSLDDSTSILNSQIPKPVDISPRKPKKFQLRVNIYNTEDVILDDVNPLTGERSSDIYIKGYLADKEDEYQKTDTHFRSLNGDGKFNWRFIFDFEYLPAEEMIIYKQKPSKFSFYTVEKKVEPTITFECWDADLISSDDILGSLQLNLVKLIKGAKSSSFCKISMLKKNNSQEINLFKVKNHRGWWPFTIFDSNKSIRLSGKLEAEFQLLSEQQALEKPAGFGRNEPDALPEPDRPQDSFAWFLSPLRTFRYVIWKNNKCFFVQLFLVILLVLFVIVIIIQLPSQIVQKTLGFFG